MPPAVHHLAVLVRDLDRAEAFYAGVLGLPVLERFTDEAGRPRSVWLALGGGAFLAVERAAAGGAAGAAGWHCVALAITPEEREPWRARLAAAGHPVERETRFTIYTRDPDGALVALSHHPVAV
jgi:glyoxylase I family protein